MTGIVLHCNPNSPPWHPRYREALTAGFKRVGYDVVMHTAKDEVWPTQRDDIHVLFGPNYFPKTFNDLRLQRLCIDRCSVGNVNDFVTVGFNGWGGDGDYGYVTATEDRWNKLGWLFPPELNIQQQGDHSILLGEYPSSCDNRGAIEDFYEYAKKQVDGPLYFRPHPFHNRALPGTVTSTDKAILHTAKRIYTYKSSFGVHCRLLGLSVFASESSLASKFWEDQQAWKRWLLCTQWHIEELRTGEFWEYLQTCLKQ